MSRLPATEAVSPASFSPKLDPSALLPGTVRIVSADRYRGCPSSSFARPCRDGVGSWPARLADSSNTFRDAPIRRSWCSPMNLDQLRLRGTCTSRLLLQDLYAGTG